MSDSKNIEVVWRFSMVTELSRSYEVKIGARIVISSKWRRFCTSRPRCPPDQKISILCAKRNRVTGIPSLPWAPQQHSRLGLRSPNVERNNQEDRCTPKQRKLVTPKMPIFIRFFLLDFAST